MIRRATQDDIPRIVELGAEFLAECPYSWVPLDPVAFAVFASGMIEQGVIFLSDDGMIGGVFSPFYFNPAVRMVAELFWWARSEGQALRQALEAWAREHGAQCLTCSGLTGDREPAIRRVYARAGYVPTEVAFVKRLSP
jgi:GNAT superfamily N-acetyltransferase